MRGLIGQEVGGYRIISQIGKGGMATVYKAYQPSLDRYVAVKVMPPYYAEQDDTFLKRFRQEAKAIASLRHPNILIVIDYGEENDTTYIVMEFVEAGTLTELLGRPMAPVQMSGLIGQVAGALHYAHDQGVVHRDIKPSNILLPKPDWPLLTDFGLAKIVGGSQLTQSGTVAGTPAYMSPEQGRGEKVDSRSDIYSLGIVLYEMATGVVPFHAETPMAVVVKHIIDPLPMPRSKNPELPDAIERVILKALAKDASDRYQDASEMASALEESVKGLPTEVASVAPPIPAGQSTTVVDTSDDVDAAAQAAAAMAAPEGAPASADPGAAQAAAGPAAAVAPKTTEERGGFLAGRGRTIAAIAGGLLVVGVAIVGAIQLLGGPAEEPQEARTQDQIVADARATLESEDPSAAIEDLDQAIEGDPENIDLYFDRARAEMAAGNPDLALESIHLGIDAMPEESWVREYAGNTMWELGFLDEAIDQYRSAIELDPGFYWLYYSIADIYRMTDRPDEAVATLFEATENPDVINDADLMDSFGWFLIDMERFDEAETALRRATEIERGNPSRYDGLVELAYRRHGPGAGIEMAETGIQQFPEHAPFYESAGYFYWELDELEKAEEAFRRVIELNPGNSSPWSALGDILVQLGREVEAEELIVEGTERNPDNPGFMVDAGNFFMTVGNVDAAFEMYERAIELEPDNAWYTAHLARAHAETGEWDRARQLLVDASMNNPGDPWLDEFIGWTYMMINDCDHAVEAFYRALEMDPFIETAMEGIRECGG